MKVRTGIFEVGILRREISGIFGFFRVMDITRIEVYSDYVLSTQTSCNLHSSIHERSALPDSPGLARIFSLQKNLGTSNTGGRPGVLSKNMPLAHLPRRVMDNNSTSNRRKASDTNVEIDTVQTSHKNHKPGPFPEQTVLGPTSTNLNDLAALILSLKGDIKNVETNLTALFESKIQILESKCDRYIWKYT
ncbi:unnamed protein product [Allacma fusca]|uniref:Uncharacterized protein n=1 Tax=Allacma fusca TaxID=39272 RepID=A0A8J2NY26_9HEXA|nr:unnamed protein product [Allacma fusca]